MKYGSFSKLLSCALVLIIVGTFVSGTAYSQARPSSKTNVISFDPLGLAYNFPLNLQYELKAGPVNSWAFRLHVWPSSFAPTDWTTYIWSAYGIGASYRFYVADSRALTGLSIAPSADIFFFNGTTGGGAKKTAVSFWVLGDLAYKWIFDQFSIEPLMGLRWAKSGNDAPGAASGIKAIISLYGGYAW